MARVVKVNHTTFMNEVRFEWLPLGSVDVMRAENRLFESEIQASEGSSQPWLPDPHHSSARIAPDTRVSRITYLGDSGA